MKPFWNSPNFFARSEFLGNLVLRPFQAFASIQAAGDIIEQAKVGILAGSLLSGLIGMLVLYCLSRGNSNSRSIEETATSG